MKPYQTFSFDSYSWSPEEHTIWLRYSLDDDVTFTEIIRLPKNLNQAHPDPLELDRALFALHMIGGVSYYKTCLPKTIAVNSGSLSGEQATYWNTVYEKGLGEFFYVNDIDFRGLINFPTRMPPPQPLPRVGGGAKGRGQQRVLVPIGGGKDSIVTIELLRKAGYDLTLFRLGAHPLIDALASKIGLPMITAERQLSGELFKLNANGALNGHVPVTAYISALSVVISLLYNFDAVALSNERSANVGNATLHGMQVNHQWSKSLEFERLFQEELRRSGIGVEYFSVLRPLSELHIAKLFLDTPRYLNVVTSCNANWRIIRERPTEHWCGKCPKCAFAFALLAAYLPPDRLVPIFGKNLFDDATLLPLYKELLGMEGMKPFECVGTPDETQAAFLLAEKQGWSGSKAMDLFETETRGRISDPAGLIAGALSPNDEHAIPSSVLSRVSY